MAPYFNCSFETGLRALPSRLEDCSYIIFYTLWAFCRAPKKNRKKKKHVKDNVKKTTSLCASVNTLPLFKSDMQHNLN